MRMAGSIYLCFHSSDRAPHDEAVLALSTVPFGPDSLNFNVGEACGREPLHVLVLRGEEHPGVREEPGHWERGVHGADEARHAPWLDDPVRLLQACFSSQGGTDPWLCYTAKCSVLMQPTGADDCSTEAHPTNGPCKSDMTRPPTPPPPEALGPMFLADACAAVGRGTHADASLRLRPVLYGACGYVAIV